jgi:hypothetical protein
VWPPVTAEKNKHDVHEDREEPSAAAPQPNSASALGYEPVFPVTLPRWQYLSKKTKSSALVSRRIFISLRVLRGHRVVRVCICDANP